MTAAAQVNPVMRYSLDRGRIPSLLTGINRWVTWRAGPLKSTGKFDKIPINPTTGKGVGATDPSSWMSFAAACGAFDTGRCSGIGIALSDQPVMSVAGESLFLIALDFDHCEGQIEYVKTLRERLGKPYAEISPSGEGIRMFALSKTRITGGNAGNGRELYGRGRFMTVTGNGGSGRVIDATDELVQLEREWFIPKQISVYKPRMLAHLVNMPTPELSHHIDRVKSQLSHVSSDCTYERWRDIVWSVLSTGWECAETLARDWSASAPHLYDALEFDKLCRSFDPSRGISLGTLDHHARIGGWLPDAVPQTVATLSTDVLSNPTARFDLLTFEDLQRMPPLKWLVRGVLPARGVAAVYGPSGSGKTFLALDLACSIACGLPLWFGAKVKAAPMAYVALEGGAGIKGRVRAWAKQHGGQEPDPARFLLGNFTLLKPDDAVALASQVLDVLGPGAVIVVDTLNQSAPGADENSSTDMGRVIANAKLLADTVSGLVILVHHTGKDAARGMRGHSSLFASMDAVIEVSSGSTGRAWRLSKSKEGESGVWCGFDLVSHVVDRDEDGIDIRSCAVAPAMAGSFKAVKPVTGKNQKAALNALGKLAAEHPDGIPMIAAVKAASAALVCPDARRHTRAVATITSLVETGHLQHEADGGLVLS